MSPVPAPTKKAGRKGAWTGRWAPKSLGAAAGRDPGEGPLSVILEVNVVAGQTRTGRVCPSVLGHEQMGNGEDGSLNQRLPRYIMLELRCRGKSWKAGSLL